MNTEKPQGLMTWIKTYPHKAMLLFFIILIPIFLLIVFGVSYNIKGKSFYFDKDDNEKIQYIRQSDLASKKELNEFFEDLEFELTLVSSVLDENDEKVKFGVFDFKRTYTPTSYYSNATFSFRYVMTANYFEEQSNVVQSNSNNFKMNFPYNLPKNKMLFLKIEKPILYVEIKIVKHTSAGNDNVSGNEEHTLYYKYDLINVEYTNVVDNLN